MGKAADVAFIDKRLTDIIAEKSHTVKQSDYKHEITTDVCVI